MKKDLSGFVKYLTRGSGMKKGLKAFVFLFVLLGLCSWSFAAESGRSIDSAENC